MMGNCQVRFLGGKDAVTDTFLPDKKYLQNLKKEPVVCPRSLHLPNG
ncbi:hypothetical protein MiSe_83750 [Microseira wollei NIES-4236]|uniref:Transposase n=1 Tax=Microseira wollei NIES-4236 TaxID=2530354 RepID=A0AAV3XNT1_9CYAN|nr:hypothetical protein MiSe_83750 [Microseira wollei NIES-4236]